MALLLRVLGAGGKFGDGKVMLSEPLTEREMQVLRLLAAGMSNSEIANRLVSTLTTVKAHTRNIFRKLEVENRTRAASRARVESVVMLDASLVSLYNLAR